MDEEKKLLEEWKEYCEIQSYCHDQSRMRCSIQGYAIAGPAILLSTISGSANIGIGTSSNASTCESSGTKSWLSIAFGLMSLVSAGLYALYRNARFAELEKEHTIYSTEFAKLAIEIKLHMALDARYNSQTYRNMGEFVKQCKRTLDNLMDNAPSIPEGITKRAERMFSKKIPVVEVQLANEA